MLARALPRRVCADAGADVQPTGDPLCSSHELCAQQHCDDFQTGDSFGFPYVFIVPAVAPPCMEWDYAGNVQLDAAGGCMQLTNPFPAEMAIDMQLSVSGAPFTGTIRVASE